MLVMLIPRLDIFGVIRTGSTGHVMNWLVPQMLIVSTL